MKSALKNAPDSDPELRIQGDRDSVPDIHTISYNRIADPVGVGPNPVPYPEKNPDPDQTLEKAQTDHRKTPETTLFRPPYTYFFPK